VLAHIHTDPNEGERVRGAMPTSGRTVNTICAQLAGSNEASGSPSVTEAYNHRHREAIAEFETPNVPALFFQC